MKIRSGSEEQKQVEEFLIKEKKQSEENFILLLAHVIEIENIVDLIQIKNKEYIASQKEIEEEIKHLHDVEEKFFQQGIAEYMQAEEKFHQMQQQQLMKILEEKISHLTTVIDALIVVVDEKIQKLDEELQVLDQIYDKSVDHVATRMDHIIDHVLPIQQEFKSHGTSYDLKEHIRSTIKPLIADLRSGAIEPSMFANKVLEATERCTDSFVAKMKIINPKEREFVHNHVSGVVEACTKSFKSELAQETLHFAKMQIVSDTRKAGKKLMGALENEKAGLIERRNKQAECLKPVEEMSSLDEKETEMMSVVREAEDKVTDSMDVLDAQRAEMEAFMKNFESLTAQSEVAETATAAVSIAATHIK